MSLTAEATDLFLKAIQAGETGLANALARFTLLEELLIKVADLEGFDWVSNADLIKRPTYSRTDCDRLTRDSIFKAPGYEQALIAAIDQLDDSESLHYLFTRLMRAGRHEVALHLVSKVDDRSFMADELRREFTFWRAKPHTHTSSLYALGQGSSITRTTIKILDLLDVDLPSFLDTSEYGRGGNGKSDTWDEGRFSAQVEMVGDTLDAEGGRVPTLSFSGNQPFLANSALAKCFVEEFDRATKLGGFNSRYFPSHLPVIISKHDAGSAARAGAVVLTVSNERPAKDYYKQDISCAYHGFDDLEGRVADEQIRLSASLLSYDAIQRVRREENGLQLALIPAEAIPMIEMDDAEQSAELSMALRFHRPEPLSTILTSNSWVEDSLATQLYLKGIPSSFETENARSQSLVIGKEVGYNPDFLRFFESPQEREWLNKWGKPERDHERPSFSLVNFDSTMSLEETLATVKNNLENYEQVFGPGFRYSIDASLEFFEYMSKQRLVITQDFQVRIIGQKDKLSIYDLPRLGASLGIDYKKNVRELGELPEDWLNKGVRSKDSRVIQRTLGMLDTLALEEVASMATTPARASFLIEHFPMAEVLASMPKKYRDRVVDAKFSSDLGL